ncbi:aminopeptidase [Polymorphobacter glacialis]|uniref:Carboxypeptidase Q n=1 Tax=Sandarakinorhabdus glacialis TaxID=1614636 RepID=A0A917A054_9SPHN|nr:M20/M25/M40 family metallo-hydrolase [Polymorphobacter glacialis]GGE19602.1 aminopeptidase [Polymorphobacter glacialis]
MFRPLTLALLITATPVLAADRLTQAATLRDTALARSEAFPLLEDLTTRVGPRLAGTPAEQRGRDWAIAAMKAAGLVNIKTEPFPLPVWERGVESAEIVGSHPQKLAIAALGYSGATPPQGITAPIAYFASYQALQDAAPGSIAGKIAFIDHRMAVTQDGSSYGSNGAVRRSGPALAQSKGAVAVLIRSVGTDSHRNPHTGGTVAAPGVAAIPSAALSLPDAEQLARLVKLGPVSVKFISTPRFDPNGQSANVSGEIPGTSGEVIVIGGHLDSWDLGTGTIDDGAGMAITLTAAKTIKAARLKPRRTIRVVFWGAEEFGLWGGRAYAEAHKAENIVLAAESDFGADRVWRIASNVADTGLPLIAEIGTVLAPLGIAPASDNKSGGGPDVGPMRPNGVGILDLEQDGTRYFDLHHTPDDTLDKVDRAQLDQNVAAWTAAIWLAASDDRPLRTK